MKTKPFDLYEAKKGKSILIKHEPLTVGTFKFTLSNPTGYYGTYPHVFEAHNEHGTFLVNADNDGDIIITAEWEGYGQAKMIMEEKEYWIASAYSVVTGRLHLSGKVESTEQNAITQLELEITPKEGTTQTHKITRYE